MSSQSQSADSSHADGTQPDAISPALRRKLQQCYEHGSKLAAQEKYDFDYANTMFTECVVGDPANLVYVEAFLNNLQRKYNNNKKGARLQMFVNKGPLKKALAKKDWADVLRLGPEFLKGNPWDVLTLRAMAQACEARHYNEVELRYLKNALDGNPKDPDVNRHCAKSLARMGHFDQAIVCWHRVEEARRDDPEPPKMISQLTIEKTRQRAGMGSTTPPGQGKPAASTTSPTGAPAAQPQAEPEAQPQAEAAPEPAKRREIPLTPRQKLERAIAKDPEDLDSYLALAQLHADEHRYADALRVLTKAQAASGGDLDVRQRLEEVTIQQARHQLAVAEKRAAADKTEEARDLARQLRANLNRVELEIYDHRSQRQPSDEGLKYELGLRLKRAGNYRPAVDQLKQVSESASHQALAALEIGECLQHLKQFPKALTYYQRAAKLAARHEQTDCHKRALYRAGILAAGLKQAEAAKQCFQQLLQQDPHYKDAQDRLDKLKQIGDKE